MVRLLFVTFLMLFVFQQKLHAETFKLSAFVAVVVTKEGQILLLKRANTNWMDGFWGMPGGSLDPHETLTEAAVRETYEEIGLQIDPKDLELSHVMHICGEREILGFFFTAHAWQGEPTNREPHFCSDIQWFPLDSLPPNLVPNNLQVLEHLTTGALYSETDR